MPLSEALSFIFANCVEVDIEEFQHQKGTSLREAIQCTSLRDVYKELKRNLHTTQRHFDLLAVIAATAFSNWIEGSPIWLYIVGPPGSGKTTMVDILTGSKYAHPVSKITGLHSGFRGNRDASPVVKWNNKIVTVKDWTTILSMPAIQKEALYGELRGIFDGDASLEYKNLVSRNYENIRFVIIAAVTQAIYGENHSVLGERFLMYNILDRQNSTEIKNMILKKSITNSAKAAVASLSRKSEDTNESLDDINPTKLTKAKLLFEGFLDHLKEEKDSGEISVPIFTTETEQLIQDLATLSSACRSRVERETRDGDPAYIPESESATRLGSQFAKLAVCLAIVLGKKKTDQDIERIISTTAIDTCYGYQFRIMSLLSKDDSGLSKDHVALKLGISDGTARRYLQDLAYLKFVKRVKGKTSLGQGRHSFLYTLTDDMMGVMQRVTEATSYGQFA